jgi:hypothetical protein
LASEGVLSGELGFHWLHVEDSTESALVPEFSVLFCLHSFGARPAFKTAPTYVLLNYIQGQKAQNKSPEHTS